MLRKDGTIGALGSNYYGECNVPKGLAGVKQVLAGKRDCEKKSVKIAFYDKIFI